jgi:hypothetical protein
LGTATVTIFEFPGPRQRQPLPAHHALHLNVLFDCERSALLAFQASYAQVFIYFKCRTVVRCRLLQRFKFSTRVD